MEPLFLRYGFGDKFAEIREAQAHKWEWARTFERKVQEEVSDQQTRPNTAELSRDASEEYKGVRPSMAKQSIETSEPREREVERLNTGLKTQEQAVNDFEISEKKMLRIWQELQDSSRPATD